MVDRAEDFVARVEELGLEGVVAKRLEFDLPPRAPDARHGSSTSSAARSGSPSPAFAEPATARRRDLRRPPPTDGSFTGAGAIELGLHRELVERLEARLAELPARRRGSVAWYPAEVSVVASLHGLADGPVRDAVLREVLDGAVAST